MTDKQLERAAKVAQVIAEHPGLPMMCLAPSTPCDYDSYYHDVCGASVEYILKPREVERKYDTYCGLNDEKYYTDESDAAEDVSQWLFELWWDTAQEHGFTKGIWEGIPSDMLTEFCGAERNLGDFCDDVADALVGDMPWHEYVVIDCY